MLDCTAVENDLKEEVKLKELLENKDIEITRKNCKNSEINLFKIERKITY